jgi:hypothetical protein
VKNLRSVIGLVGLVFGAVGAVRELQKARGKQDRLAMIGAVCNIAAVVTGVALTVRGLRGGDDKDGDTE